MKFEYIYFVKGRGIFSQTSERPIGFISTTCNCSVKHIDLDKMVDSKIETKIFKSINDI